MSLKGSSSLKLDLHDRHFWLKVCRSPDDSFTYANKNQYKYTKKAMLQSSSFDQTFIAHFDDEKLTIFIWRQDKRLPT